ncbi:hypothetical protein PMAYCL1PPCAC_16510, partial [Pristionchus mayeri]
QLYWIAPVFFLAFCSSRKRGVSAIVCGLICSTALIICITAYFDLYGVTMLYDQGPKNKTFKKYVFMKPWAHCIPYLFGISIG